MIDREEAIIQLKNLHYKITHTSFCNKVRNAELEALEMAFDLLTQPKTDWIPCEVELPKTNGVYQVIRKIKEGEVTYYISTASYFDGQNTWHNDICVNFGRQNEQNVIAWQPIQPYKKAGEE